MMSVNAKFNQGLRLMVLILAVGALVSASGCSRFRKKPRSTTQAEVPANLNDQAAAAAGAGVGTGAETGDQTRPEALGIFPEGTVRTVYFDFDKSAIRQDQVPTLNANLKYLMDHADNKVYIEGHCDEKGTVEYNLALGERRAGAVRDYFMQHGLTADRVSVASKGKEQPVDPGHSEAAYRQNRRVEFKRQY